MSTASTNILPPKKSVPLRKRVVSQRTKEFYQSRSNNFHQMSASERKTATTNIWKSSREDYRQYLDSIITDIETADRNGNIREVTRLTKIIAGNRTTSIMPSKDLCSTPIPSTQQLLHSWNEFLSKKFASPDADDNRNLEHTVPPDDCLTNAELDEAFTCLKSDRAPGWDNVPIEAYKYSPSAKSELFRIVKLIWNSELVPPMLVRGIFIMLYKKGERNDFGNYRAICLLCHAYKLLSAVIAKRLHVELESILPDSQAGFRPARGTRDNICILRWTINMILRESREAVVTFIDYTAAFDTESQVFLDEALSCAGVSIKIRRVIQSIFNAASGCVRIRNPDGSEELSEAFDISRGVLQGDIFSPVAFIVGLWHTFAKHDLPTAGVTVGDHPNQVTVQTLEYADDAGLLDENTENASARVTAIAIGSRNDAAMEISKRKTKALHIHSREAVSETSEHEVVALNLKHKCPDCDRTFPKARSLSIHRARWCTHGQLTRSRKGSLADKAVQYQKRKAKESLRSHVVIENEEIENVYNFEYLGSLIQGDGEDDADVNHRMNLAQVRFSSLYHLWNDHRVPTSMKLRLYKSSVCFILTHGSESWVLTKEVIKSLNGFNSRCLHTVTGKSYRDTANSPDYNLVLAVRRRRMRYLGHIMRMQDNRLVKQTFTAYVRGGTAPPEGSLLMDCATTSIPELTRCAEDRTLWQKKVNALY